MNLLTYNVLFSPVIRKWYVVAMFTIRCFIISMKRDIMNIIKSICCNSVHEWRCNRHFNWENVLWGVWSNCNTNCKSYTILQIATVIKDQTRFLWFCHFTNKSKHSDKWDSCHESIETSFMTLATKCSIIAITCWNIDRNISKGKWLIMTSFVYISQAISLQEMSFQGIVTHH